eukprot:TRINITY_DN10714_c0_g2_i1.p1 TRINITY_DN10714_c0_g2~~TRINITY_DN10714_c0_g2_i1.p1  ORF type:complete len:837 (+),score=176.30 TRINITY_DN10714_c0_g2_i1:399-2909(+)
MVKKCSIVNCKGNYDNERKCRVFRLPTDESEKKKWLDALPPRENFIYTRENCFICEQHWDNPPMIRIPGGSTRPTSPPSVFDVPKSCLPTPRPSPRPAKDEDRLTKLFLARDRIISFENFDPVKDLQNKYDNVLISRSDKRFVCLLMSDDHSECSVSVVVQNKKTLCSPLTLTAFRNGIRVPLGAILNPNNGLNSKSQFFDAVHFAVNYDIPLEEAVKKVVVELKAAVECSVDHKVKKLEFLTHQLELLAHKQFTTKDICFAIECFPRCSYEQLREYLVMPSKRKLQDVVSSVDKDAVLRKTFDALLPQQKNVFLLIDEVKIRPTVAFAGGVLSGMAKNNEECRATSMLCIMMKSLYRGPSVMVSVTPVHKLTAGFQFHLVKEAAVVVERSGGHVLGSITDNHKVNQHFCKLFDRPDDNLATATHPLDNGRDWFLLFDTVHLLKCIRNNWITEKTQKIRLSGQSVASFSDVKQLYEDEKDGILKTTPLTKASVNPSKLQLQNVQHVLKVFNEKVVGALKMKGCVETASVIETVVNWWNTVNVSKRGLDKRRKDHHRAVQESGSFSLDTFLEVFHEAHSGHGPSRIQCLTHDTKKALVQTMRGLKAVCDYLISSAGFDYVILRELQSDRLEGEFSVYRQSTGSNIFMTAGDVFTASKRRLAQYAASYLQSIELQSEPQKHTCLGDVIAEDADAIENCISGVNLSVNEESSCAYVAGWLESKCDLTFDEEEPIVTSEVKDFIEIVSRGSLTIPHDCTFQLVRLGLCFVKQARHRTCCRKRLSNILSIMASYKNIDMDYPRMYSRLSNVLLNGLHNLEKDHQRNAVLVQTSVKRARLAE